LYEFVDDNPTVAVMDGSYVNNPYVIAQNDNQVSINTALEVDLTGQVCSESIGSIQFSGAGGQADTAIGAQLSKGGRSFICLYSTAFVKNPATGEKEEVSKIVAQLKAGAIVTLQRQDVQFIVTEYGIADLHGLNVRERVAALIKIAHPKFREQLKKDAIACGIIGNIDDED
ncbi:MAG: acetyl-CoA hydrolase/transferase C-terminal domain-containing protein, partial [Acholeplasmataceae bacterium]